MEVITKNPIIVEKKSNVGGEVIKYASPDAEPLSWDRAYFGANGENHSNAGGFFDSIKKEMKKAGTLEDMWKSATQMPKSQQEALAKQEKMLQDSLKPSATDEALLKSLAQTEEKKGISMGAKIGIGVGVGVLLLTIIILVVKSSKK